MEGVMLNSTKKLRACFKCKLVKNQETVCYIYFKSGKKKNLVKIAKFSMMLLNIQHLILKGNKLKKL